MTSAHEDSAERRRATFEYLDQALYSPIPWPGKNIRCRPNRLLDAREGLASSKVNIAELFHENSKLFPEKVTEASNPILDVELLRDAVVRRHNDMLSTHAPMQLEDSAIWSSILGDYGEAFSSHLLSADLRVVFKGLLAAFDSRSCVLRIIKRLSSRDLEILHELPKSSATRFRSEQGLAIIVGMFGRSGMLYGVRGYRRALLTAGMVAGDLMRLGRSLNYPLVPLFDFVDVALDSTLDLDGVEQGTLMLLGVADD